ncbi:MAG: hypothetical protein JRG91_00375 [Deltaproteobacteria bacterium]|nr:hypothetical protein [Deltaproteobacteria bacterium]
MKEKTKQIVLVAVPLILALVLAAVVVTRERREAALAEYLLTNADERDVVVLVSSDFDKMHRLEGRRVIYSDAVHWDDVMGYDVAWVVGPGWLEVPMLGEVTVRDVGPYRVHRIDLAAHSRKRKGYNLLRNLHHASVHRSGTRIEPCPRRSGVFACVGEPWFSVDIKRVFMGGAPFECIYAHPRSDGELVIVFPQTPGGGSLALEGGIDDDGVYYPHGADVEMVVEAGGREIGRTTFGNVPGVQERVLTFVDPLQGPVPLVVKITAENQDTRHFCFTGWLEPAPDRQGGGEPLTEQ